VSERLTKEEAAAYRRRWQIAAEAERAALRATSPDEKFRQFAALMASVESMGWSDALAAEDAEVRARWIRLREALRDRE